VCEILDRIPCVFIVKSGMIYRLLTKVHTHTAAPWSTQTFTLGCKMSILRNGSDDTGLHFKAGY